ncbi:MAG: Phosphoglucomutase/phosphomannomutase, alpha/beta/alpha domain II, partial [Candidatus Woesebacteria bacterium GW2011_GWA1_39_11b]
MDKKLFGTSGIRGNAEELFTSQFCYDIALTFIEFLRGHGELGPIAVGMDPRKSGPRIKEDLLSGLSGGSVPLFDEGITPIPSINWLLLATEIKAAIMITGSHIAPELNGVKFYAHNEEISASDMEEIESLYEENKNKGGSSLEVVVKKETRAKDLYKKMLVEQINLKLPKWKIAVDCANGAQTVVFPDLLGELGFEVVKINCSTEKDFIARDTDTDDKAEIEELKKAVVSEKCDFGIAFDGDGDRSVFIDETGEFVTGEYSCTLIANHLPGSSVVTTVAASQVVDSIKKSVYKTKVGSPYVIGEMKKR